MSGYGIPYTVRGWDDEVVTTVSLDALETVPDGYLPVLRTDGPVILVPTAALTPVDTTPAEPEPGVYDLNGVVCMWFIGDDSPRHWAVATNDPAEVGAIRFYSWRELWAEVGGPGVTIRRLIPEPAPVDLPWEWNDATTGSGHVLVGVIRPFRIKDGNAWISVECAEAKAAALLTAARAAREATR
jgi:hypothetical protein